MRSTVLREDSTEVEIKKNLEVLTAYPWGKVGAKIFMQEKAYEQRKSGNEQVMSRIRENRQKRNMWHMGRILN